jgi:quinol-cytochrome oxidoreductase complex cytochrome b subunit
MGLGSVAWFGLVALLWSMRPGEALWLLGSVALGIAYSTAFFWYVTRSQ